MPDARSQITAIFSIFGLALTPLSLFAPLATVPLLLITAVLAALSCWRSGRRIRPPDTGVTVALAALLAWSAVSALWAFDPFGSLLLTVRLAILFGAGLFLVSVSLALDDVQRRTVGRWLLIGFIAGLAIMAEEIAFGFPLTVLIEGADPNSSSVPTKFNRVATELAMLCWPVAAHLWQLDRRWQALGVPLAVGIVLAGSESLAASLGVAAGAITIAIALAHRSAGRALLVLAAVSATAGAPFLAQWLYSLDWQNAAWLPDSAQQRVEIWHTAADLIAEKPMFGWGFDASRELSQIIGADPDGALGMLLLHPHNAGLQVLLELGAVGAALAFGLLWVVIARLDRMPPPSRIFGQACFAATMAIAGTAYGVWQNHWLATVLAAAIMVHVLRPSER